MRWFDRLAERYHTPAALLEQLLTPADLQHEIARLIADAVISQAWELGPAADKHDRQARMRRRLKLKRSKDWFDQLVVERWRTDEDRRQAEKESHD